MDFVEERWLNNQKLRLKVSVPFVVQSWQSRNKCARDTENGREVKKGVIPVFGAGAYNPKEKVVVNGQKITLAQYASRMNIRLLRPTDFNSKLRERRIDKIVTVQKICRICKDEKDVRFVLDEIWQKPLKSQETLGEALSRNESVFEFEKILTG